MKAPWRGLRARFRTRPSADLVEALAGQLHAARDGAVLAEAMLNKRIDTASARTRIAEIEHHGDEMRGRLVDALARTLVAPLDREDLYRLSRSIDDILDTIRDFVREADLYQIESRKTYRPFLRSTLDGINALDGAATMLWSEPREVPVRSLQAKKAAGTISRTYQKEMAKLVESSPSAYSFKHRELLSRLDLVGTRINDAADALTDGTLKRGY